MRHIKTYEQLNNEQKFDIISPENTDELMLEIVNQIDNIKKIIDKNRSTITYKIKKIFQKKEKLKPYTTNPKYQGLNYLYNALMKDEPTSSIITQYQDILKKHNNGTLRFYTFKMEYDDMILMYEELKSFKRRLDGLEILIKHGLVDDYQNLVV